MTGIHTPREAVIESRVQESDTMFTLRLRFTDAAGCGGFAFHPGQFNMVYLHGVGEVPISIVSDPLDECIFDHTIRTVGRVTRGLAALKPGDRVGIRGPFGRGWPLREAEGKDIFMATGGLGCAPLVSVIRYLFRRRERFGRVTILQGVKHSGDLIWRDQYAEWAKQPDTQVLLAADSGGPGWSWYEGPVTKLFDHVEIDPTNTLSMLCGPELMMLAAIRCLHERKVVDDRIWLSMERNMHCGTGFCGHCQIGPLFVCHDGPVFRYTEIAEFLGKKGF